MNLRHNVIAFLASSSNYSDSSLIPVLLFASASFLIFYLLVIRNFTHSSAESLEPTPRKTDTVSPPPTLAPPPPQPDPDIEFRIVLLPESSISTHSRCRDTCRYLWYETLMLRSHNPPSISSETCVYLWTALFYIAAITLRNQDSVGRIYDYFAEITSEFVSEEQYKGLVVEKIRAIYRTLRQPLNTSKIDPRSDNGRLELWNYLILTSPELLARPGIRINFLAASERVWKTISDVFPQSRPYPYIEDIRFSLDVLPDN